MKAALDIRGLKKVYNNGMEALRGVDLTVEEGQFYALLGPNGAGKSTLIGILTNLVNRSSGSISVFGLDSARFGAKTRGMMGVVPQEFNFNIFEKALDIVIFQAGLFGIEASLARQRAKEDFERLGLADHMYDIAKNLSGGMKRRLMIARALVNRPRLLVLDEPTAGVDIQLRKSLWDYVSELNRQGTTVILTTHYLEEAEQLCQALSIIDHGKILQQGTIADLLHSLDIQTFVLDLTQSWPNDVCCPWSVRPVDELRVEIEIPKQHGLNELFAFLDQQDIRVTSMRNKTNRLEELFVRLVRV